MASLAQRARLLIRFPRPQICAQCRRSFGSTPFLESGHNKWSKIKHEKAAADKKKTMMRTGFSEEIALHSKLYGPDLKFNPQLARLVSEARKSSVPKAVIETAIARGQGLSSEGAVLENVTFEAMVPPAIALIVEVETDRKPFYTQEMHNAIKKAKGGLSTSKFFFTRVGRVTFGKGEGEGAGVGVDDIMDDAIEAGAEDLNHDADGNIVVHTQPTQTRQVCDAIAAKHDLRILSSGIVWVANEDTKTKLNSSVASIAFADMLDAIRDLPDVQSVYSNVSRGDNMTDEEWARIAENLDVY
ncbi:transcriptional regulator TACO1-like protein [Bombardia bombarda]|uniref:Transcriptional regulator TACO1-like protein n=1 Tax=Bombardia bombarda TaxID=252184 RepID=A0AA39WT71_9PEZI|nr:transcriptional regulator TACO1-like protein [Bombardia bombarda]